MCVWTGEERERKGPAEKKVEKVGGGEEKEEEECGFALPPPPPPQSFPIISGDGKEELEEGKCENKRRFPSFLPHMSKVTF